ncbi:hypothetical protein G7K_2115-t1 [Saitoella complicata NRRL Y-17804]|uniref:Conidiation-specific protein 6 n=2 Tax=Saitoella complicata (strain BCRC 22490 / CBS 7301 / JCM 7358 / NBRC 10748 / NRRL Y-17804) TaxID=698492 RepID=A0A0E9NDL0_SAICN|nr:hypothetical protein G7K_2115-t1 [Saitoella complicata NRRL Y-17804]
MIFATGDGESREALIPSQFFEYVMKAGHELTSISFVYKYPLPPTSSSTLHQQPNQTTLTTTPLLLLSKMTQGNVAGGYKATLSNPNTSDEAKQHAQEVLDNGLQEQVDDQKLADEEGTGAKNTGNVIGGYKATLKNPNVSEEAKEHAQDKLDEFGA